MKLTTKELILFGTFSTILTLSQIALASLPNIEVVSLLIILFSLLYHQKAYYIIIPFVLLEGLFYGFGSWWFGYLIIWPLLATLTILFEKGLRKNYLRLALFSGGFGLAFGGLFTLPYLFIADGTFALTYWIRGIPYDLIHMVSNYLIMVVLGKPLFNLLHSLNNQYFHQS